LNSSQTPSEMDGAKDPTNKEITESETKPKTVWGDLVGAQTASHPPLPFSLIASISLGISPKAVNLP